MEELLREAMSRVAAVGLPLRVTDIAAGHGRYVLDALQASEHRAEAVVLRDTGEINVRDGRQLIDERGLTRTVRFDLADAFDRASLAGIHPRPTVGVVSGLYELFDDNTRVQRSLAGPGPTPSRSAATSSTPASPGIRSWS